ncbi:M15 family metallopeptidase [Agathobaculum sp.]|uniref:M15 family metallopeptidase n=1 Tax=Agathobaculum sp. TaxID=2048138 RepID=UPI002A8382C4|nr:M15 family metallopeptidase [Agathobaculum sp.]MDY3617813.1 M15 family metallopeptidase [Agathobaculum sp.]
MPRFPFRRAGALALLLTLFIPEAGALSGVSNWAQAGVNAAKSAGLEPAAFASLPAKSPVTRAEFCSVALNAYKAVTGWEVKPSSSKPFNDCDSADVVTAYELGLVNGRGNGVFDPKATIQRQDLCVMLYNVLDAAGIRAKAIAGDAAVEDYPDASTIRGYAVDAMVTMVDHKIVNGVAAAGKPTQLSPSGTATREQALIMASRFTDTFEGQADPEYDPNKAEIPDEPEPEPDDPGNVLDNLPKTKEEKMELVYGKGGEKYQSAEEAKANMTEISVKVWRLQPDGSKLTGTAYLIVNKNLAPIYEAVFDEIYRGKEQFPIKDAGCYAWRTGEHSQGTAIDLNWEENMEATINADGTLTPTTGTHWTPGEDPYSIPEGGDVYNAFTKYGFLWGGNAWRSKRDYMHFSYFGT